MAIFGHLEAKVPLALPTIGVRRAILEALPVLAIELDAAPTNGTEVTFELRARIDVAVATGKIVDEFIETARILIGAADGRIDAHARCPDVRRRTVQLAHAVLGIHDEVRAGTSCPSVTLDCASITHGMVGRVGAASQTAV